MGMYYIILPKSMVIMVYGVLKGTDIQGVRVLHYTPGYSVQSAW